MFNLIVGYTDGEVAGDRMLEHTVDDLKSLITSGGDMDVAQLQKLPTVVMPEPQNDTVDQVARVGLLRQVVKVGRKFRYEFEPFPSIGPLDTAYIEALREDLDIGKYELNRHHWAVKDVDLLQVLATSSPADEQRAHAAGSATADARSETTTRHNRAAAQSTAPDPAPSPFEASGKTVFIVHGHDEVTKFKVARLLQDTLPSRPVILHEQPNGGRAILEKFESHAANAAAAVVLLTGDDVGRANAGGSDRARPRQNVVYEAGYFAGLLGRGKVVLLHEPNVELPSDLAGIIYTTLDAAGGWRVELLRELQHMGLNVLWAGLQQT